MVEQAGLGFEEQLRPSRGYNCNHASIPRDSLETRARPLALETHGHAAEYTGTGPLIPFFLITGILSNSTGTVSVRLPPGSFYRFKDTGLLPGGAGTFYKLFTGTDARRAPPWVGGFGWL